ncbi:ATP-dependent RNA helicase ddx24 [Coelomomyces lativittatus]|nr:ATP-dependent RNA helicase ddx24 [Coelomomyces lativittatus]KAJ1509318.1 ATP-dependent RNA helicase ddx24 [Coelomomyces lativittatus]KAJ1512015.1 ATP-dependent RNA helicase ddx24 [Coelomomyces lativittatus]
MKRNFSLSNAIDSLTQKRQRTGALRNHVQNLPQKALPFNNMDDWGWKTVQIPVSADGTHEEDFGAVLDFQELSGVDVVFDENNPSFIQFNKTSKFNPVRKKETSYTQPMSKKEMKKENFIHVDTVLPCDSLGIEKKVEKSDDKKKKKKSILKSKKDTSNAALRLDADVNAEKDDDQNNETIKDLSFENTTSFSSKNHLGHVENSSEIQVPLPEIHTEDLEAWIKLSKQLHPWILKGIENLGFQTPTQIQQEVLPLALHSKVNIVGAAPTGSGKTLAFGIPILNSLVKCKVDQLYALILTPTRELALQVTDHLRKLIHPFSYSHPLHRVHIVPIVGGVAEEKQRRFLSKTPHVIVATPGRFYDLMDAGLVSDTLLKNAPFLVIDEADKMLASGKFKELEDIVSTMTHTSSTSTFPSMPTTSTSNTLPSSSSNENTPPLAAIPPRPLPSKGGRRIFVFSATLPTVAPTLPKRKDPKQHRPPTLKELLKKLNLHKYKTIDVTSVQKTASTLLESKVLCLQEEKDAYLYYLLHHHPGKTLVFVNAITCLRRLIPLLMLLKLPVYPLHAQMQQRQRFKNLERFANDPNGILLASDVASRGLDIPLIDHVIHYQVPLSSDLYVHRSGRTARANASGLSIVMVSPKESVRYKTICTHLGHKELPDASIQFQRLEVFKQRLEVAQKIETLMHQTKKENLNQNWMTKASKALEIELDDDSRFVDSDDEIDRRKRTNTKLQQLRLQLDELLKK